MRCISRECIPCTYNLFAILFMVTDSTENALDGQVTALTLGKSPRSPRKKASCSNWSEEEVEEFFDKANPTSYLNFGSFWAANLLFTSDIKGGSGGGLAINWKVWDHWIRHTSWFFSPMHFLERRPHIVLHQKLLKWETQWNVCLIVSRIEKMKSVFFLLQSWMISDTSPAKTIQYHDYYKDWNSNWSKATIAIQ